jgi:single-strand DNA-binding protein
MPMADLNKVFLIGRLTQDPELRYTPNRVAVIDLGLATSRTWTGKEGEKKEDTLFVDVTVWNRQAEMCGQFLKKGSQVHIEGYLKKESWESPAGEKRSKIKVEADRVQFLDRRGDPVGGGGGGAGEAMGNSDDSAAPAREPRRATSTADSRASRPAYSPSPAPVRPMEGEEAEDDIPF